MAGFWSHASQQLAALVLEKDLIGFSPIFVKINIFDGLPSS